MENGKWKIMKENVIADKSFSFAVRIVKLYQKICREKKEYVLSKQLLKSGTSIGANVSEALQGQSKRDFHMKMNIALKEASETKYWLRLLHETELLSDQEYQTEFSSCVELEKILTAIVRTTSEKTE